MRWAVLTMLTTLPAFALLAAEPDAWLELSDGSRIPGRPLGRTDTTVYWQLSDQKGYAEIPFSIATVRAIVWRQPPPVDVDGNVTPCPAREGYWDLLAASEKRQWFIWSLEWVRASPSHTLTAVRVMRALRQRQVNHELKRRILEEESVALIRLGLADVAAANLEELRVLFSGGDGDSLLLFIRAAAEMQRGESIQAMQLATAGFLNYNSGSPRWRTKCAGLAIHLMEANGLLQNAQLLRRSAKSQKLPIEEWRQTGKISGGYNREE